MELNLFAMFKRKRPHREVPSKEEPSSVDRPVDPPSDECPLGDPASSQVSVSSKSAPEVQPSDAPPRSSGVEDSPSEVPLDGGLSDEVLEEWAEHYTNQFWTGANRTNTILVTWGASLALIFGALIPLSHRAAKYEESYGKYVGSVSLLAKQKNESVARLSEDKAALEEQITNPEAGGRDETEIRRLNRINAAKEQIQALNELSKDLKEEFKERQAVLDNRFRDIKTLKSDLFPFNVPLGKLDIPVSFTPLVWVSLFTGFLFYFLYKRLVLIGTMAQILHIQVDLRGKKIDDLKGLGSGAPSWIAPLPSAFSGSGVSREEVRQFLGWEPRAIRRSTLTYGFLLAATVLYIWVAILSIQVVRIYDNPQLELGLMICLIGTFALLAVSCWSWLLPRIQLESYPETLIGNSTRRQVLLGIFSSAVVVGYVYMLTPRRFFPLLFVPDSKRSKDLVISKSARKTRETSDNRWRGTFQLNKKTQVIHYVSTEGRTKTLGSKARTEQFAPYSKEGVINILTANQEKSASETPSDQGEGNVAGARVIAVSARTANTRGQLSQREIRVADRRPVVAIAVNDRGSTPVRNSDNASDTSKCARLVSGQLGTIAEALAIEKMQAEDIPLALKILWAGIQNGGRAKSNYRLYDLFAFIAFQHSQTEQLNELINHVSEDTELKPRVQKWQNNSSKWAAKVKGGEKIWKMPTNSM
jgi:hypothetical protein